MSKRKIRRRMERIEVERIELPNSNDPALRIVKKYKNDLDTAEYEHLIPAKRCTSAENAISYIEEISRKNSKNQDGWTKPSPIAYWINTKQVKEQVKDALLPDKSVDDLLNEIGG